MALCAEMMVLCGCVGCETMLVAFARVEQEAMLVALCAHVECEVVVAVLCAHFGHVLMVAERLKGSKLGLGLVNVNSEETYLH
jgi:hypothetical protein